MRSPRTLHAELPYTTRPWCAGRWSCYAATRRHGGVTTTPATIPGNGGASGLKHFRITGSVLLTYLFVALLHGFWDGLPRVSYLVLPFGVHISVVSLVISVFGLAVLGGLWRQALRRQAQEP